MKLQIVKYSCDDIFCGKRYRYVMELDGRAVSWTGSMSEKYSSEKFYDKLTRYFENNCIEYDINKYPRYNLRNISGVESEVIFEQEVSDHYLKDIKIQQRINELKKDFA